MFTPTFSSNSNTNINIPSATGRLSAGILKTNVVAQDELIAFMLTKFEDLVKHDFLPPHFLKRMVNNPPEILKFLHQNRAAHYQLKQWSDPHSLETKGEVLCWDFDGKGTHQTYQNNPFMTLMHALKLSCVHSQCQENDILLEMEQINNEMKELRATLDIYVLSPSPVVDFEKDEQMIRGKFNSIQEKLSQIAGKQNKIHHKLNILHNVENSMNDLLFTYEQNIKSLVKHETMILKEMSVQLNVGMQDQNGRKVNLNGQMSAIYDGKRNLRRKVKERIYELLTQVNVANSMTINFIQ